MNIITCKFCVILTCLTLPALAESKVVKGNSEIEIKASEAAAAEVSAKASLRALQVRRSKGEAVSTEEAAAAHEAALIAHAAASRARFRAAAEANKTDSDAQELRRELIAAPTPEARRAILARHLAVERALEQEQTR